VIDTELRDECIGQLEHPDSTERVLALRFLLGSPEMANALADYVEKLLTDRTVAMVSLPMRFGEIRNLAAEVVATGRAYANNKEPVILDNAYRTLTYQAIATLADAHGLDKILREGCALYEHLRDSGHLKSQQLEFVPDWYSDSNTLA
jgi:hypothetical protein